MKKGVSLVLVCLLVVSLGVPALAVGNENDTVTRGEFVAMVNAAYNFYTTDGSLFTDVDLEHPYAYEVMAAQRAGYLNGYPDGSAGVDEAITRLEAAVMLDRVAALADEEDALIFTDAADIPEWAAGSIARVCADGLMFADKDGAFLPDAKLTAAEAELAVAGALAVSGRPWTEEIITATSYDGFALTGRLCLPDGAESVDKVVLLINGTGPCTYESEGLAPPYRYKYFDVFADEFAADDIAFFSYNTRGVHLAEAYPYYSLDWDVYGTYTPQNCAKDVVSFIQELKQQEALAEAEIILLGWSEGAVVAPLAALEPDNGIDAILMAGYPDMNMADILVWQLDGGQTFFYYTIVFNAVGQDHITREQYELDPYAVIGVSPLVYDLTFDELDTNGNGVIDVEDFAVLERAQLHKELLEAIERNDTEWICNNFMMLPAGWFTAHFELGRTGDILAQVDADIPMAIFHGTYDLNCPVQGVYDVRDQFEEAGLEHLEVFVFEGLDHSLLFDYWLVYAEHSEGYLAIFDYVRAL